MVTHRSRMGALSKFMRGLLASPHWVKLWLGILMAANMVVPLVYFDHLEAHIVLITFLASFVLLVALTSKFGFTRILGLGHIIWIPLVLFLLGRLDLHPANQPYGLWIRSVIILNSISLIIDVTDLVRYIRGERAETVTFE